LSGLSQRLSAHIARVRYEDLPPAAVEGAKRSLLDAIGVSLGASALGEGCAAFAELALSAGGSPESSVFGHDRKAPAQMAALANGAMAHALDYEDAFDGAPLHPNAALVPAALALAEARGGVSGRDLIAALAAGCDLACRLALCVRTPMEAGGWYPPPIFGAYGATAAAGKAIGLDAEQLCDAFSLTLCQATCSGEIKHAPDSVIRAVREAFPAQAGVVAAQLAARGVRGFAQPFEGKCGFFQLYVGGDYDEAALTDRLGAHFYGADVSFKPWPSCRGTHAYVEAALALRAEGVRVDEIETVALRGAPFQAMLAHPIETKRAPRTAIDAKFSLPFTVAVAFVRGGVALEDFTLERLRDEEVLRLAARISFEPDDAWEGNASGGALSVVFRDGGVRTVSVVAPLGAPSNPIGWAELVAKAQACARHARAPVEAGKIERLAALIGDLENAADAARAIFATLVGRAA
jgi:2-methylcitrate dehydratase PrpD